MANLKDFGGEIIGVQNSQKLQYATMSRYASDLEWEESVQFDAHGRGMVISHIRSTAPGRLISETPEAGWLSPSGAPCREHTDNAKPAWIWYTE